jgi:hypothetical protein
MRKRLMFGAVASAIALSAVPAAQAAPRVVCSDGFETVCTVLALYCKYVSHENPCMP